MKDANFHSHFGITKVKVSNNGKLVATGDNNKSVMVWDATTKELLIHTFVFHMSTIFDISWSADDKFLVSVSLDDSAIVWSIESKKRVRKFACLDGEMTLTCDFISDKEIIVGGCNCTPRILSIYDN